MGPVGQLTLPSNPNCVLFAAEAGDVLGARPFREVQRIVARALLRFHLESGLPAAVALAWRAARDRKNRKFHQVTASFVFDGAATSAHIGLLEEEAAASPVLWSEASIERLPPNAVPTLQAADARLCQLWVVRSGRPVVQRLVVGERGVSIAEFEEWQVGPSDFLEDVAHVVARPASLDELDADIERMRLVFADHFTRVIVEADGVVREDERQFVDRIFPAELMERLGVLGPHERTYWLEQARERLPNVLGHHDKLAMIGLFFSACYSDGSLDAREMRVLREAGETLGLTRPELVKYLQRLW